MGNLLDLPTGDTLSFLDLTTQQWRFTMYPRENTCVYLNRPGHGRFFEVFIGYCLNVLTARDKQANRQTHVDD